MSYLFDEDDLGSPLSDVALRYRDLNQRNGFPRDPYNEPLNLRVLGRLGTLADDEETAYDGVSLC